MYLYVLKAVDMSLNHVKGKCEHMCTDLQVQIIYTQTLVRSNNYTRFADDIAKKQGMKGASLLF